jgi:hypothetical protein
MISFAYFRNSKLLLGSPKKQKNDDDNQKQDDQEKECVEKSKPQLGDCQQQYTDYSNCQANNEQKSHQSFLDGVFRRHCISGSWGTDEAKQI